MTRRRRRPRSAPPTKPPRCPGEASAEAVLQALSNALGSPPETWAQGEDEGDQRRPGPLEEIGKL